MKDHPYLSAAVVVTALVSARTPTNGQEPPPPIPGTLTLASTSTEGAKPSHDSGAPTASADGNTIAFTSFDMDPVNPDGNRHVYVKNLTTGVTTLASSSAAGVKANRWNDSPSISADGYRVAFVSQATNLHPLDTDPTPDVYVKDLRDGSLWIVSTSAAGNKGNSSHFAPCISADGTRVAFAAWSSNLHPRDDDGLLDIYVREVEGSNVWLASTSTAGDKGNAESANPSLSADGARVSFHSKATNLDPRDIDPGQDVYVKDVETGTLWLASASSVGAKGNGTSWYSSLSADGRAVAFYTDSTNLHGIDGETSWDVYVKSVEAGDIALASTSQTGVKGNGASRDPSLSADGTRVAFTGEATNLHTGDSDALQDVYVKDLGTGRVWLASSATGGTKGDDWSGVPSISGDGSRVAFQSSSTNLDPADGDDYWDVYIKELTARATPLEIDTPTPVTLTGDRPQAFFSFVVPRGEAVILTLDAPGAEPGDATVLYVRWGAIPSDTEFDDAADTRAQAHQRLVLSDARGYTGYALVQANRTGNRPNELTLTVELAELALEEMSASHVGAIDPRPVHTAVVGGGFEIDTAFQLVRQEGGFVATADEVLVASSSRAEMVFDLGGAPTGLYDLRASSAAIGQEVSLAGGFRVVDSARGPWLQAELSETRQGVRKYRYDRIARLTLRYRNSGDQEMVAPLLKITSPPHTELRLAREDTFQTEDSELQVLAIHPGGVPGILPAGGGWEIPIEFRSRACLGKCTEVFEIHVLSPTETDVVGWDDVGYASATGMSEVDWIAAIPGLSQRFGATWREYGAALAALAGELSRRGANAYSPRELFRFAVRDALGRPATAAIGRVVLAGTETPIAGARVLARQAGLVKTSTVADTQGDFALDWLEAGGSYEIAIVGHEVVGTSMGGSTITVREDSDVLGLFVFVTPSGDGQPQEPLVPCPVCNETGLPLLPISSASAFTLLETLPVEIVSSVDPNEKEGPKGEDREGLTGLIPPGRPLDYTIHFENLPCAGAPVQVVVVRDILDLEVFDFESIRLRDVQIGRNSQQRWALDLRGDDLLTGYTRNLGLLRYSAAGEIDVRIPEKELLRVELDVSTDTFVVETPEGDREMAEITWEFRSLTSDPLTGFLPPNYTDGCDVPCETLPREETHDCKDGRGEAHVSFSVSLVDGVPDGTVVVNPAVVTFDGVPLPPEEAAKLRWENRVSYDFPPEPPFAPHPPNGADRVGGEVDFSETADLAWEAPDADTFDVFLWVEGAQPVLVAQELADPSFPATGLLEKSQYRWQVRATNAHGSVLGSVWTFSTGPLYDLPPEPVSPDPPDGAVGVPVTQTLDWDLGAPTPDGSPIYRVFLWRDDSPPSSRPFADGLLQSALTTALPLVHGARYNWQVIASRGGRETAGAIWTFQVAGRRFVRGDVDASGSVDLTDAIFLLTYLYRGGQEPPCLEAADVNDDSKVAPVPPDLTDAIHLLGWLYRGTEAPLPPAPTRAGDYPRSDCGLDPPGESVGCAAFAPCPSEG